MKTFKGKIVSSLTLGVGQALNPEYGNEIKMAATDGGTVVREWQIPDGLYVTQLFLNNGGSTVIETISDGPLG